MRRLALALADATAVVTTGPLRGKAQVQEDRVAARAGRGQLAPLLDYLVADSRTATATLAGGSQINKTVQRALDESGVRDAVSAWDALYGSGESDPTKLQGALDDLTKRVTKLSRRLNAAFGGIAQPRAGGWPERGVRAVAAHLGDRRRGGRTARGAPVALRPAGSSSRPGRWDDGAVAKPCGSHCGPGPGREKRATRERIRARMSSMR